MRFLSLCICAVFLSFLGASYADQLTNSGQDLLLAGEVSHKDGSPIEGVRVSAYRNDLLIGYVYSLRDGRYELHGEFSRNAPITRVEYSKSDHHVAHVLALSSSRTNTINKVLLKDSEKLSLAEVFDVLSAINRAALAGSMKESEVDERLMKLVSVNPEVATLQDQIGPLFAINRNMYHEFPPDPGDSAKPPSTLWAPEDG